MIRVKKCKDGYFDYKFAGNAQDVAEEMATAMIELRKKSPATFMTAQILFDKNKDKEGEYNE